MIIMTDANNISTDEDPSLRIESFVMYLWHMTRGFVQQLATFQTNMWHKRFLATSKAK